MMAQLVNSLFFPYTFLISNDFCDCKFQLEFPPQVSVLAMGINIYKQAEAEVVPSSSLVEDGIEVEVEFGVEIGV